MNYTYLADVFRNIEELKGKDLTLKGWIRNHRKQNAECSSQSFGSIYRLRF